MDFYKLKESGEKIKMPSSVKMRIKKNCIEHKTPETVSKSHRRSDVVTAAICVCCFLLLTGIGLKYSKASQKAIPVKSTTVYQASNNTEKNTFKQIVETTVNALHSLQHTNISETQPTLTVETKNPTQETEQFTTDKYAEQNCQPATLYLEDSDKLKNAKKAAKTMNQKEYEEYLIENDYHDVLDCFYYPEEYLEFCESEIYVPVIEQKYANIKWMDYVPSYGSMNMGISFNETDSFRFYIEMSGEFTFRTKNNKEYKYVETLQTKNFTADIYKEKFIYRYTENWAWDGFSVELNVDGQNINLLTTDDVTLEELKEYLGDIEFIKIKDWI